MANELELQKTAWMNVVISRDLAEYLRLGSGTPMS